MNALIDFLIRAAPYWWKLKAVFQAILPALVQIWKVYQEIRRNKTMASIKVTVTDSAAAVLSGVTVTAGTVTGTTGTDGTVTLEGLTAGTAIAVKAALSGYTDGTATVTPADGSVQEVSIALTAEATDTSSAVTAVASVIAPVVVEAVTSELDTLKTKVQAKIDSTHSWTKIGWILTLQILNVLGDKGISYAKSKLGITD
jgi:hypothetical protein